MDRFDGIVIRSANPAAARDRGAKVLGCDTIRVVFLKLLSCDIRQKSN